MNERAVRIVCSLFVVVFLASCGGGASGPPIPTSPAANPGTSSQTVATLAPISTETANPSDSFVDAIGVVMHFEFAGSPYATQFPAVRNLLHGLGVRHVREVESLDPNVYTKEQALASDGLTFDFVAKDDMDAVTSFINILGRRAISTMEAPSEPNVSGDPNWVANTRAYTAQLHATLAGSIPLLAPAMAIFTPVTNPYATIGDLSSVVEYGNMHNYTGNEYPGTSTASGSLTRVLSWLTSESGNKPVIASEAGFCTDVPPAGWLTIPATVATRYEPRMFLENFRAGVVRVYQYELVDQSADDYSNCGLVDGSLNPKPSYTVLKTLIAMLADPGPSFVPGSLSYSISGVDANVHHMLYARRDGTFYLMVWVEANSYDPVTHSTWIVAPQRATFAFAAAPQSVTVTSFQDDGTTTSAPMTGPVALNDHLTILTIAPARNTGNAQRARR